MSDTPLPEATRVALARSGRREWDGLAAVIAAFVGLLALAISAYTAYLQHQQVRAQVWPYLEPEMSGASRKIMLFNKGVGPALIRSVEVTVDGKPQRNWKAVFAALGLDFGHHVPYSTINGIVIAANDHVDQLVFPTDGDFDAFVSRIKRVNLTLCYCSSLDECWLYDDAPGTPPGATHKPVAQCPARGADEFLDNENPDLAAEQPGRDRNHQENKP